MKRLVVSLICFTFLLLPIVSSAKVFHLKLAIPTGTTHPFYNASVLFKKAAEKYSHGQISIELYPNRMLGGDKEIVEGVRDGTIDMGIASSILMPLVLKRQAFYALQLPFLVKSYAMEAKMLASPPAQKMLRRLKSDGIVGLAMYEGGLRNFLSTKGPVTTLKDFKGLRTRIVPVPLFKQIWQTLGTDPVGMAYGEVYTGLQTHVIDAVETNISSVETDHYYEAAKYLTLTGQYFWPGVMIINARVFNSLPKPLQNDLVKAGKTTVTEQVMDAKKNGIKLKAELKKQGMHISKFKDINKMQSLMKPILDSWSKKDPLIAQYVRYAHKIQHQGK